MSASVDAALSPLELNKFLATKLFVVTNYDTLVLKLRRKQLYGGHACALATIELLRCMVS